VGLTCSNTARVAFGGLSDRRKDSGALRAAVLDRAETLRVPVLAVGPFPTAARSPFPDRPSRPERLAARPGGRRRVRDPVVRVDPHDRVLHRQLWRRRYWRPVGFTHGNGTPARSVECADVGPGRVATNCSARRGDRTGPRTRRSRKHLEPLDRTGREAAQGQDVSRNPGGVRRRGSAGTAEPGGAPPGGVWIDSTVRCMTVPFCRVPRPRSVLVAPSGVDLFSGRCRDRPTCGNGRQLEHVCVSIPERPDSQAGGSVSGAMSK